MIRTMCCLLLVFPMLLDSSQSVLSKKLTSKLMENAKVSKKYHHKGVIIIITSKKSSQVEKIKKVIIDSIQSSRYRPAESDREIELLRIRQISKTVTLLTNGIQIDLSSDHPLWIHRMHRIKIQNISQQ